MTTPEVQELIRLVENKYTKFLNTTTDFEEFSLYLNRNNFGNVSPSTLKRLWGYVNDTHEPRRGTLNVLASYIGHDSFDRFIEWLKKSALYNSSFFTAYQISSSELNPGDRLEIGWTPNRLIHLTYLGESTFEVNGSENSKLMEGDRFITGCFIKGHPFYLPYIIRGEEHTSPFIGGRNGGISCINVIRKQANG